MLKHNILMFVESAFQFHPTAATENLHHPFSKHEQHFFLLEAAWLKHLVAVFLDLTSLRTRSML